MAEQTKVMTEQEIQELRDIQGFIEFCINTGQRQGYCLANIGHDCGCLLLRNSGAQDGGAPRTSNYAKYLPWGQGENKKPG